jgi:hypothetical protein
MGGQCFLYLDIGLWGILLRLAGFLQDMAARELNDPVLLKKTIKRTCVAACVSPTLPWAKSYASSWPSCPRDVEWLTMIDLARP